MSLSRTLRKLVDRLDPPRRAAFVGHADGSILVAGSPNYIKCTWPDGVPFIAWNDGAPIGHGSGVDIIEDPKIAGFLRAVGPRMAYGDTDFSYAINKPHGDNHKWPNFDATPVHLRQFLPGLVSVASGLTVKIQDFDYYLSGAFHHSFGRPSVDLSASIPTSGARYALVSINSVGTIVITNGTPAASFSTLDFTDIPAAPVDNYVLCAVRLVTGQTVIRDGINGDILDLRLAYVHYQPLGAFGDIHVHDAGAGAQSIATGATYTKLTCFTDNGASVGVTADATNDKITLTRTGTRSSRSATYVTPSHSTTSCPYCIVTSTALPLSCAMRKSRSSGAVVTSIMPTNEAEPISPAVAVFRLKCI